MNFKALESQEKLSGSYYTPKQIADFISRWVAQEMPLSVLEPSCGDGVFALSLAEKMPIENVAITLCDTNPDELGKAVSRAKWANYKDVRFVEGDFVTWALSEFQDCKTRYDAVIGNPPFVRYQYMDKSVQEATQLMYALLGQKFTKHSNLWVAFVIAALELSKPGARIGLVVPEELLSVIYAEGLRSRLLEKCSRITIVSGKETFNGTLQGYVVLLAERRPDGYCVEPSVGLYRAAQGEDVWSADPSQIISSTSYINLSRKLTKWTGIKLSPDEFEAFDTIKNNPHVSVMGDLADVEVGIVTGANSFFLVNEETVRDYGLSDVAYPAFGRSAHCPGIIYDEEQHEANAQRGMPTNLILIHSCESGAHKEYISHGEQLGLHERYKCRIRRPWYEVPSVRSAPVALLKRSNAAPRLILNEMNAFTTDTAYRVTPHAGITAASLVFSFTNSITALSAELEGRYYGGGVLELVPSEIRRMLVPYHQSDRRSLRSLDRSMRSFTIESVLQAQDSALCEKFGIDLAVMDAIRSGWQRLSRDRRSVC